MKKVSLLFVAIAAVGLGVVNPTRGGSPDSEDWEQLTAEWWQWALSIPTPSNPLLDTTGDNCMVGQRGSVWFLAGFFFGGAATRTCSVPEDKALFFPVVNYFADNTPNICGQGPDNLSVKELRAGAATYIDSVTGVAVQLDGEEVKARRVKSKVFEVAMAKDNIFVQPCNGDSPAGIFSPAIDDGYYVELHPLKVGSHTLHFQAQSQGTTVQDITYKLTVVPVLTH